MAQFTMTCLCGDTMTMEADSRDEAVAKFKDMMTKEAIEKHMAEKHPGQPLMSVADCHAQIEKDVKEAVAA